MGGREIQMNKQEIAELSMEIVQTYYQNNTKPFLDYVDEKVLWYGPAKGQFLQGRQSLLDAWGNEYNPLTFSLGNIRLDSISTNTSFCEVLLSFPVTTHFPNGDHISVDQIIHLTWCERKREDKIVPRMLVIHISNLYQQHESDKIYPVHFNEVYNGYTPMAEKEQHIFFKGTNSSNMYLLANTILYAESTDYGRHSVLHTVTNDEYKINSSISELEKNHPDFFLRAHKCYLVNPQHITGIERFKCILTNGKEIPVPEKKYTAFKKTVQDMMKK
jgi:hypothetical protein